MENLILLLLATDVLGNIKAFLQFISFMGGIGTVIGIVVTGVIWSDVYDVDLKAKLIKLNKIAIITFFTLGLFSTLIPNTQTMHIALGLTAAKEVYSEVKDSEIYNKSLTLLNKKLDEAIEAESNDNSEEK